MIEELETCPQCNCVVYAKDIREEPDPYASEINGDDTPVRQCEGCRQSSAADI